MPSRLIAALALSTTLAVLSLPDSARACGGCFGPVGQPSAVTAHRMAIALSNRGTTLWDQFEYQGAPEDFVWVLPVSGGQDVTVELSDDTFFQVLQQRTQVTLQAPARPGGGGGGSFALGCGNDAALDGAGSGPTSSPVVVYNEAVIGPYETVTLGSEEAGSLVTWLQDHGYGVPDDMLPTIDHYVNGGFNFVVLRLAPGEGIQRMQPVRVTSPGLNTVFPLRMVAAGVLNRVALELYVFAEGRYEAQNFPNGEIDSSEISYDWSTGTFSYDDLADEILSSNEGRTWLTEFAQQVDTGSLRRTGISDESGLLTYAENDVDHVASLFAGHRYNPHLTRMRADLTLESLSEDLELSASMGGDLESFIFVTKERNRPRAMAPSSGDSGVALALGPAPYALLVAAVMLIGRLRKRR